ncbi:hypothetical protein D3C75_1154520 [compost metagenome]
MNQRRPQQLALGDTQRNRVLNAPPCIPPVAEIADWRQNSLGRNALKHAAKHIAFFSAVLVARHFVQGSLFQLEG